MKVTYIEFNGTRHEIETRPGINLMEAAVENMVPGVIGDCGGSCSCGTCHVYVGEAWREHLSPVGSDENDMLEAVAERQPGSRLSCQIKLTEALDGLEVSTPESQF